MDRHTLEVGKRDDHRREVPDRHRRPARDADDPGHEFAITSNEAFHLPDPLPKRITVVGGGYIAVEFAGIFNGLGCEVDIVIRRDRVLRGFDEECRTFVHETPEGERHQDPHRDRDPVRIEATDGKAPYQLHTQKGEVLETDLVMYATGRVPNTAGIGLEKVGRAARQGGRDRGRRMVEDHGAQHLGGGRRHRPHQPHAGGDHGRPRLRRHRVRQQAAQGRPSQRGVGRVLPARDGQCRPDRGRGAPDPGRGADLRLGLQADEVHAHRPQAAHLHEADRRGRDRQGRRRATWWATMPPS